MNNNCIVLLSSAYLAPVQYYSKLVSYPLVCIEQFETYQKQSYRNRCIILGANGPLTLSVPVEEGPRAKAPMNELKLSYEHHWQQIHWRSIVSAYKNSPYFDYYADELAPFYHERRWETLIGFNSEIQEAVLKAIGCKADIQFTGAYVKEKETPEGTDDFRYSIHPKPHRSLPDGNFKPIPYQQVFNDPATFIPNLSIIDLLFNEGPNALEVLRRCLTNLQLASPIATDYRRSAIDN